MSTKPTAKKAPAKKTTAKKTLAHVHEQTPLQRLARELAGKAKKSAPTQYRVPALWAPVGADVPTKPTPAQTVEPYAFFHNHVEAILAATIPEIDPCRSLNAQISKGSGGNWIKHASIYNVFIRLTTAYDHDGDGQIGGGSPADLTLGKSGVRETGTFLKTIALLGHIKRLGCDVVHFLPVTSIGRDGNKGALGSPYAIKNPYELDAAQADPLVSLSLEDQFAALIEACHRLGMRVIGEFVFRTAARDGDWIREHPEWFYWIDARIADRDGAETDPVRQAQSYGNPIFPPDVLAQVKGKIERNERDELPPPPDAFRHFFTLPPAPETVHLNAQGSVRGKARNPATGEMVEVRVPGAFADWPPDDTQPPWGDVTYLKMYLDENPQAPRFNYIAYNTIRMYDNALARPELANRSLWDKIRDIVPFFQSRYGLDGIMVDMGHAMPVPLMQELVAKVRAADPDFCFLSENFEMKDDSVKAGYNAVMGYIWWTEYKRDGLDAVLNHVGNQGVPIPYFATSENHNTPRTAARTGGERYVRMIFALNLMLPAAIPFIHSGLELGETQPVNTGLDFTPADVAKLQGKPLPLFDIGGYHWDRGHDLVAYMRRVLALRTQYRDTLAAPAPQSFVRLDTGHGEVFAFLRRGAGKTLLITLNRDLENAHDCRVDLNGHTGQTDRLLTDLLTDARVNLAQGRLQERLQPAQIRILEI